MKKKITDFKLPRTGMIIFNNKKSYRIDWHDRSRTTVLKKDIKQSKFWWDGKQYIRYEIINVYSD